MWWWITITEGIMIAANGSNFWKRGGCLALLVLACGWSITTGSQVHTTPSEVVDSWLMNYPHNLDTAAELTTLAMRHFKPPNEWSQDMKPALMNIKFRYLEHKILTQDIQGKRAVVTVEAFISTIGGNQVQKEEYVLLLVKDEWLIDKVNVVEERFLGQVIVISNHP